ncbi:hypothetical protein BAUCODRAFT_66038 [Baudoinia panamericana UAMH 10762]|uniref:NADP-dependent oxidoreductase domain-containing protein n=1 Tax=Baudoinia panamericana (strain UAMH 10762) TaxID=717646 RepID=M2MQN7_BAUPA|nr:uncharacterized protein BAUCODRAFT_66038 [Baudoinia panamericana UAMH 10762]EMC99116.1 hypothetical protein BAUCODRAFT_66038 [Baudoinia panamericana UAMH 10762]
MIQVLPLAAFVLAKEHPAAQVPLEPSTALTAEPLTLDNIPLLGYGTWNLKGDNVSEAVSWAIQAGYRHIDCAAAYGNEDKVGRGIADGLAQTGLSREDLWVTSKLWNDHHGLNAPESAIDTTLQKLGVGYLDLYHMHWPVTQSSLGSRSVEYRDTWAAMGLLLEKGKTRHIGVSNFDPEQLKDLLNHTSHPPSVHQMEMHPYLQQNEWLGLHQKHGIHVTAYSPLAGSNPTYDPGNPVQLLNNTVITKIASKRGCTPAQVALAWGMARGTSVIPKSQNKERILENFGSLKCELKKKDLAKIDALGKAHHRYNNPAKAWKVDLYVGLEDSKGKHELHE